MNNYTEYKNWLNILEMIDEGLKRKLAAVKALELGWGGISEVSKITGMSRDTIRKGIKEIKIGDSIERLPRIRKIGGGRKRIDIKDPIILHDLEMIMDENTAGDPTSLLKWTSKSTYRIANELNGMGHDICPNTVVRLLKEQNYSLQANVKTIEGGSGPERDEQFKYINTQVKLFLSQGNPVISVDTKKRELVGNFKQNGRTWEKKGEPRSTNVYDFRNLAEGIAIPYGIYDIFRNDGFVNVGVSRDTSEFAVESIRQWWNLTGEKLYPHATGLLICADGGGSNGSRRRGWKYFLQGLVDEIEIPISVCHLPPGTSKWNKIEHKLFSFISINWKGKPLVDYQTIINLINSTSTKTGLYVVARLDEKEYEGGRKFTEREMATIRLKPHELHPKWNYTIEPKTEHR